MPVDASNASRAEATELGVAVEDFVENAPKKAGIIIFVDAARTDPFESWAKAVIVLCRCRIPALFTSRIRLRRACRSLLSTVPTVPLQPRCPKHIKSILPLAAIDRAVRAETMDLTKNKQIPWTSVFGRKRTCFSSPPPVNGEFGVHPPAPTRNDLQLECGSSS